MKTLIGAAFFASGLAFSPAWADDAAGSNIALSEYPGPACTRLQKPVLPQPPGRGDSGTSGAAALIQGRAPGAAADIVVNGNGKNRSYNDKVDQYNKDLLAYNANIAQFNSCIKTYMDNGKADLMRVQQKLNAVAAAVNAQH